jgi:hypothetical protein
MAVGVIVEELIRQLMMNWAEKEMQFQVEELKRLTGISNKRIPSDANNTTGYENDGRESVNSIIGHSREWRSQESEISDGSAKGLEEGEVHIQEGESVEGWQNSGISDDRINSVTVVSMNEDDEGSDEMLVDATGDVDEMMDENQKVVGVKAIDDHDNNAHAIMKDDSINSNQIYDVNDGPTHSSISFQYEEGDHEGNIRNCIIVVMNRMIDLIESRFSKGTDDDDSNEPFNRNEDEGIDESNDNNGREEEFEMVIHPVGPLVFSMKALEVEMALQLNGADALHLSLELLKNRLEVCLRDVFISYGKIVCALSVKTINPMTSLPQCPILDILR